ncbi:Asp-tRNA(Asn)/Glu-tRNA(Gln) amidotransferase subunit GatB [Coriobacteriia bacterium Es71-Z0120]|uniref:Asp-tRNA(Asn)/Glu-tRNA(Gln) amidotransferase subunit GatB n=1 Tax=Parvivirga hydrogeniphila TaxID=2939460 RepID=UPI002260B3ED|nr:Asp-tRNA(Asn)/Glu-tRNA(Gln) amidotransferase subunit GatB [Parvivirga hydrogeniphila]MCL4078645.1 Asp-tRNA(Asn)/Glu-tRNA(Gln) amidotransferase subunit GatB [Parvivirga hydrogeniphila]
MRADDTKELATVAKDRLNEVLERYEAVIGLEIHTELTSLKSKMFCSCPVEFGGEPNTRVCPVCLGMPGALPVPNQAAVEATILAGLALGCEIARFSQFHRKNYFYPDMPKNYQISQYDLPFCMNGHLDVEVGEGDAAYVTRIGITRIHLEEDTGKMIHVGGAEGRIAGADHSLVDFNRAGTPLIELVTEPDIRTPEEARRFAQSLRTIFLALGISDCSMEEGSMRVDANVSVRPRGATGLGTKAEVKNMNSFKALHDALAYEIVRQADLVDAGGRVVQETRHWDAAAKRTSSLRSKEEAHDYRYFPEPDMVPFEFTDEQIAAIRERLPELPAARRDRYVQTFGLPRQDARLIAENGALARFFEAAVAAAGAERAKPVANWVLGELSAHLNATGATVEGCGVTPEMLAELVVLIDEGTISGKQAKEVFAEMTSTGEMPGAIVERKGMRQVSDADAIEAVVAKLVAEHPEEVASYRSGKTGLIGWFVGQVMREMRGQANPAVVNEVLRRHLDA